jgi:hypothetical protein
MESLTNRKKVVSDKPMTLWEKIYLPAIISGMVTTLSTPRADMNAVASLPASNAGDDRASGTTRRGYLETIPSQNHANAGLEPP